MSDHAQDQARAQVARVVALMAALASAREADDWERIEAAEEAARDNALSVEVRSGWTPAGDVPEADEYRIVLCTGGPHVELRGELGVHLSPKYRVRVCWAGWGGEGELFGVRGEDMDALAEFCQLFFYGD